MIRQNFYFDRLQRAEAERAQAKQDQRNADGKLSAAAGDISNELRNCFDQLIEFRFKVQRGSWGEIWGSTRACYGAVTDEPRWSDVIRWREMTSIDGNATAFEGRVIGYGEDPRGWYIDCLRRQPGSGYTYRLYIKDADEISLITEEPQPSKRSRRKVRAT